MISVKLIELGSETKEIGLHDGAVLTDLLDEVGKNFDDGEYTRNHQPISEDTTLYDRDRVFFGKATKGNLDPFEVNFIRLGDTSVSVAAQDGYTIKRTLQEGLSDSEKVKFFRNDGSVAYEFRIGGQGQPVNEDHVLQRPTSGSVRVICSQRVKGNL